MTKSLRLAEKKFDKLVDDFILCGYEVLISQLNQKIKEIRKVANDRNLDFTIDIMFDNEMHHIILEPTDKITIEKRL